MEMGVSLSTNSCKHTLDKFVATMVDVEEMVKVIHNKKLHAAQNLPCRAKLVLLLQSKNSNETVLLCTP